MDAAETVLKVIGTITMLAVILGVFLSCCAKEQKRDKMLYEQGYLQACKDCAEGKLKYELKEVPGGERIWIKKETLNAQL